jgi:hypothetical protein
MEPGAGAVPRSGVHPKKFWGGCKKNDPHVYIYQIIPHNHTMIPIIPSNIIQHVVVFELGGPFLFFFWGDLFRTQSTCSETARARRGVSDESTAAGGDVHCGGGGGFFNSGISRFGWQKKRWGLVNYDGKLCQSVDGQTLIILIWFWSILGVQSFRLGNS